MALRHRRSVLLAALSLAVLLAVPVSAHVPGFVGENTSHADAMHIEDGAKSRSIYAALGPEEVRYFEVHLETGERLQASVFTPTRRSFTPGIVVYGPDIEPSGTLPPQVEIPDGMGARVVPGTMAGQPEFEPFTPAAYFQTAAVSMPAENDHYWVAVYEPDGDPGRVGTAIGYVETFTPAEYVLVPVNLVAVHLWEGDSPLVLVGPYLLGLGVAVWLFRRRRSPESRPRFRQVTLGVAGGLFLGGGLLTGIQLVMASAAAGVEGGAILSLVFTLIPLGLGIWVLDGTTTPGVSLSRTRRGLLLGAALLGLMTWGGILLGPVLLGLVAVLPDRTGPRN